MADDTRLLKELQTTKAVAIKKGKTKEVADCCNSIGEILSRQGKHRKALAEHQQELAACEQLNDCIGQAIAHRRIGECFSELQEFKEALTHQQQHLELSEACANQQEKQRAYATIGRTFFKKAEYEEGSNSETSLRQAENAFRKALDVAENLKNCTKLTLYMEMRARLYLNLGLVYEKRGEMKQCEKLLRQAIFICQKHELNEDLFRCRFNLAEIFKGQNKLTTAQRAVQEALKTALKLKDKYCQADALLTKSHIFFLLGDYLAAKQALTRAWKLSIPSEEVTLRIEKNLKAACVLCRSLDELSDTEVTDYAEKCKHNEKIGDTLSSLGLYTQALPYYTQAVHDAIEAKKSNDIVAALYVSLAVTCADLEQYPEAVAWSEKELQYRHSNLTEQAKTLMNIAVYMERDNRSYEDVYQAYSKALSLAVEAQDIKLQYKLLKSLSVLHAANGDADAEGSAEEQLQSLTVVHGSAIESDDELESDSQPLSPFDPRELSSDDDDDEVENETIYNQKLRSKKPSWQRRNEKGETPLHRMVIAGNLTKVKSLIQQGHPVNPRDGAGWTPLHEACNFGFHEIAVYLIKHGARVNDRGGNLCNGLTPLHDAAQNGHLEVISVLLKHGANVIAKDGDGRTPLDALRFYRKSYQGDLEADEIVACTNMEQRVLNLMANAGGDQAATSSAANLFEANSDSDDNEIRSTVDNSLSSKRRHNNSSTRQRQKRRKLRPLTNTDECDDNCTILDEHDLCEVSDASVLSQEDLPDICSHASSIRITSDKDSCLISEDCELQTDVEKGPVQAYASAIRSIGSAATRLADHNKSEVNSELSKAVTKPALIPEDEYIVEHSEWLEDDLRHRPAKRKRTLESTNTRSVNNGLQTFSDLLSANDELLDLDCNSTTTNCSKPRVTRQFKKSRQLRITSIFDREESGSPISEPQSPVTVGQEVALVEEPVPQQPHSVPMRVRVKVENKTLLIPVPRSSEGKTLSWLADEASHRYYALCGQRPQLTLCTKDGAVLGADDNVIDLVSSDEEILGTVDSWDLPPLTERYVQACEALKTTKYRNIKNLLAAADDSYTLNLSNLALRPQHARPIFRSLRGQHTLCILNLSGNRIGDEGCKEFVAAMQTFESLTSLNLSSNEITYKGLQILSDRISDNISSPLQLKNLRLLDLSFNCLGDNSTKALTNITSNIPDLTTLKIASCGLTQRFFQNHRIALSNAFNKLENFQDLDVSLNALGATGIELLLKCLRPDCLRCLNLAGVASPSNSSQVLRYLRQFALRTNCELSELNLSSCYLDSDGIQDVSQFCSQLISLDISSNVKVGAKEVCQILTSVCNGKLEYLNVRDCCLTITTDFILAMKHHLNNEKSLRDCKLTFTNGDIDSLCKVWKNGWGNHAKCHIVDNLCHFYVSDNI